MSEPLTDEPVIGDGVVTLPPADKEDEKMPADLPEAVANQLITESVGNIQANNRQGRDMFTVVSGSQQAGVAKTLNELGPVESRSVSGVLATPIAGPTTQAP